jgi:MEMO1 family protein
MNKSDKGSAVAWLAVIALALSGAGCDSTRESSRPPPAHQPAAATNDQTGLRVRSAAVAGLFYPGDAPELSRTLDALLEQAPAHYIPRLRGLVCPHAGYSYSGLTAAAAYKTLAGREIQTVVILGPSHYAAFSGASIPDADAYRTPLGSVPLSDKARQLVRISPFVLEPQCLVRRPPWWAQAPKAAPPTGADTPETWEHSVEVQVPFLQKVLKGFSLLPVVYGDVDPESVAKVLAGLIDDKTIVIASSDLSHYHPYDEARQLDNRSIRAICNLDVDGMKQQEACGQLPILTLMNLAQQKGWKAQLLDSRNSGDVTSDKERVVGYTAIAFYEPTPGRIAAPERKFLLELARRALVQAATNSESPGPEVNLAGLDPILGQPGACFVTLTENGSLRGCIGHIQPQEPLCQAVLHNARNAATRDPRFPPVQPEEVGRMHIEISVLTEPEPLTFGAPEELLAKLRAGEDGVLLKIGARGATFLPQVWAQIPDKTEFLDQLSRKAGCEPSAWRGPDVSISIYHVEAFEESP